MFYQSFSQITRCFEVSDISLSFYLWFLRFSNGAFVSMEYFASLVSFDAFKKSKGDQLIQI